MGNPRKNTKPCKRCQQQGDEYFWYLGGLYEFDVERARCLVADGRKPVEVEEDSVRYCVDTNRIHPHHIDHVNPQYPGIIAHVAFINPDGSIARGHVLIDGNHRAARCLRDHQPFFAFLLSRRESQAILLAAPPQPADRNTPRRHGPTTAAKKKRRRDQLAEVT